MDENDINLESIFDDDGPVIIRPPMAKHYKCTCNDNEICLHYNLNQLRMCKNFEKFVEVNPIVRSIFEDKIISVSERAIFKPMNDIKFVQNNIDLLVKCIKFHYSGKHKAIFIFALFDYLIRNAWCLKRKGYSNDFLNIVYQIMNENKTVIRTFEEKKIDQMTLKSKVDNLLQRKTCICKG